jgi:hypothetical protein
MSLFKKSTLLNTVRNLSACFCCVGGMNEQMDFFGQSNDVSNVRQFESFQEDDLCRFPLICPDALQAFSNVTINEIHPLLKKGCLAQSINFTVNNNPFVLAASQGNYELVKRIFKGVLNSSCFFDWEILNAACISASAHGHCEVLKFLFEDVFPESSCSINCGLLDSCCIFAAANGHLSVLKFLLAKVFPENLLSIDRKALDSCCIFASANGHLQVLKFLFAKAFPRNFFFIDDEIVNACCVFAAANGQEKVLKFLFTKVIPKSLCFFDNDIFNNCLICATANGQLEVLNFLFKRASSRDNWFLETDIINDCCLFAFNNGQSEVLEFFSGAVPFSSCSITERGSCQNFSNQIDFFD